jgi:hypothetical protein
MATITFDAEELIGKLDAIRSSQLPYAASRAMNQLGWQLKSNAWPAYSRRVFRDPVPFTESALGYQIERGSTTLTISMNPDAPKGQDPARYLSPVETGGSIYVTRFSRALKARNMMPGEFSYASPWIGGGGFSGEVTSQGNVRPSYYQSILAGLERGNTPQLTKSGRRSKAGYASYRFFSVPDGRRPSRGGQHLPPGIYRAKGRSELKLLFRYLQKPPTVPAVWDFEQFALEESRKILPGLLNRMIEEALR